MADFPTEVGPFKLVSRGEANADVLEKLRPSGVLEATYEATSGERVELSIMYWAPFKTRTPKYVIDMHPHRPDGCYPATGWTRDQTFDVESEIEGVPYGKVHIRLFKKADRSLVVLYWVRKTGMTPDYWSPSPGLRGRIMDLARYWNDPLVLRGDQYYVRINADVSKSPESARETVIGLARAIAPVLPEYGIRGRACMMGTHEAASRLD